jgi:putative tryptophan/tyrosine transport system substrate-binding protein
VSAQEPPVIGWLSPATTESYSHGAGNPGLHLLRESLAKHGLIDGKNARVAMHLAEGKLDRLPELAKTLVRDGASVILAYGEEAARAAQMATKTLPIVAVGDDLVDSGLAAGLARPGSNMTGVSILATELDAKKIEVLKELLPDAKRFGILNDPATGGRARPQRMAATARHLDITLQTIDIRGRDDVKPAFQAFQVGRADGINIVASALLTSFRQQLGELSLAAKLPAVCQWRSMVEAGCLASYGIKLADLYAISANQVARVLKGEKPADLPVIQPDKIELIISLKTAKMLGLSIAPLLLARADEVIE